MIYRCTRIGSYNNPRCDGFSDKTARLGYYIEANTAKVAIAQMTRL